jgi:hypothetical protein
MRTPKSRTEWPMEGYLSAWRTFRRMSNENAVTAAHLVSLPRWPRKKDTVICDLGCGDGRLLESIVVKSPEEIGEVRLVDPDGVLLREAEQCLEESGLVRVVRSTLGTAEEHCSVAARDADVVLAVHVAYLLAPDSFDAVLSQLPTGVPCYIVLDAPGSIFTTLWKTTAPKYYDRVLRVHEMLRRGRGQPDGAKSSIRSSIVDPLTIERKDLRDAILSILCYADTSTMSPAQLRSVEDTIRGRVVDGHLTCESVCYEV